MRQEKVPAILRCLQKCPQGQFLLQEIVYNKQYLYITGTVEESHLCNKQTGDCQCKANVDGRTCNQCRSNTFNLTSADLDGCQPCDCDPSGTFQVIEQYIYHCIYHLPYSVCVWIVWKSDLVKLKYCFMLYDCFLLSSTPHGLQVQLDGLFQFYSYYQLMINTNIEGYDFWKT